MLRVSAMAGAMLERFGHTHSSEALLSGGIPNPEQGAIAKEVPVDYPSTENLSD